VIRVVLLGRRVVSWAVLCVLALGFACVPALAEPVPLEPFNVFGFSGASYAVSVDPATMHDGAPSLLIRANGGSSDQFGANGWAINVEPYRGKRVQFAAFVKTDGLQGRGSIWLRVDGNTMMFDNMMPDRALSASHDWTRLAVVLDVPADATGMVAGGLVEAGRGSMWIAAPQLDVVSTSTPTTGGPVTAKQSMPAVPHTLSARERAAVLAGLRLAAAPLTTVDPDAPLGDLGAFERAVGAARIVGLGEGTHGTSEFFSMKDRLLRDLVEKKGFTVFAIEANEPEAREMDRYVTTGDGDPAHALKSMYFWTWQTREVLELANWMRSYNEAPGAHPILHFAGFDMQVADVAVASVTAYARLQDPAIASAIVDSYACLPPPEKVLATPHSAWEKCSESVAKAATLLAKLNPDIDTAHDARIVEQFVAMNLGNSFVVRDRSMAENVQWLADTAYPKAKIVLWAHNGHIRDGNDGFPSMGSYLRARYGTSYYRLGFEFDEGSIRAVLRGQGIKNQIVGPAPHDTLNDILHDGGPRFFLNLDALPAGALRTWLGGRTLVREMGSAYDPANDAAFYLTTNIRTSFDGLIFIDKSHAAEAL
jgi:erythromycin esterase